jgi:hypothetical protein
MLALHHGLTVVFLIPAILSLSAAVASIAVSEQPWIEKRTKGGKSLKGK